MLSAPRQLTMPTLRAQSREADGHIGAGSAQRGGEAPRLAQGDMGIFGMKIVTDATENDGVHPVFLSERAAAWGLDRAMCRAPRRIAGRRRRPWSARAGERIQIVNVVPVGGDHGMIALRHEDEIAIAHGERFVDTPVRGIDLLDGKAFRAIDPEIVNLLQVHLVGRILDIVLVRRIARPVAAGCVDFTNQDAVRGKGRLKHVVDLACGIPSAADLHANIAGADEGSGMALFGFRVAEGELARRFSRYRESGIYGQVKSVREPAEDIAAAANCGEISRRGAD